MGGFGEYVDYVVFKGVIDVFIIGLVKEVVVEGICVNVVCFGLIYIDIYVSGGEVGCVDWFKDVVFMKCGGIVEEVVYVILWLLLDEFFYVMGIFIDVFGGC